MIGPLFAAGALVAPSAIAAWGPTYLHFHLAKNVTSGEPFSVQHSLFTMGLSMGLASGALALYHKSWFRRLLHFMAHMLKDGKAVIFLHMEGSHFGYKDRYPASFNHFREGQGAPRILPLRETRLVDEYDNSVYFTDYNVRRVIDRLAECACKSGLIYFSDHGERLFDNGFTDSNFGHGFPTVSRQEIEIPLLFWLSCAYQEANPSAVARLKANTHSAAQLDNLFETIADLAGVDYDDRAAALSLFSGQFRPPDKLEVLNMQQNILSLPVE